MTERTAIECMFCLEVFADDAYSRGKDDKLRCTSCGRIQTVVRHIVAKGGMAARMEPGVVAVPLKKKKREEES